MSAHRLAPRRAAAKALYPKHTPAFTPEWAQESLYRFERIASEDALGPADLYEANVGYRRIRTLYPFSAAAFTSSFAQLVENPADFHALRRAMHPLRAFNENDLGFAEEYHWSLSFYLRTNPRFTNEDLIPLEDDTAGLAERMRQLYGSEQNSLAKLTVLSRNLHLIPTAMHALSQSLADSTSKVLERKFEGIDQLPRHYKRGSQHISFDALRASTEHLLNLLEAQAAQQTVSLRAEN